MKKILKYGVLALLLIFIAYHSVYFRSLASMKAGNKGIDAAVYADRFFNQQLLPMADSAVLLNDLKTLLNTNKEEAFRKYGHALSIGSIRYFLVRDEGIVSSVSDNAVMLQTDDSSGAAVSIATEFVFGNAIRDAAGRLSLTEFSNLSDVNNISLELNKIVRTKLLPSFRKAVTAGNRVRVYGAIELNEERLDLAAIEIIPIRLNIVNP